MLNPKTNERELAYVVKIDNITSIPGYDRVELAHIGGWTIVVGKGEFQIGDPAIYFEIDSKLPEVEPFINMEFLVKKKYKIKTQKMCKSLSQGLLLSAKNFGWNICTEGQGGSTKTRDGICEPNGVTHFIDDESRFLTKQLGVTYLVKEDNKRKVNTFNKYKKMTQRHKKLFSYFPFYWLMKKEWGKKFLFIFFGKKKDKKNGWPYWIKKTDEERVENMPWILKNKHLWYATEKIDGSSCTFSIKRHNKFSKKLDFYVCSRNVVMDSPNSPNYYDTNIYWEMAEKYNIRKKMEQMFFDLLSKNKNLEWITIQGEIYGNKVQKRDYGLKDREFRVFNFIDSIRGRWTSLGMLQFLENYDISCVPILDIAYILPDTIDELRKYVEESPSIIDGKIREGIVFRSMNGSQSFKCVSPNYLMKNH